MVGNIRAASCVRVGLEGKERVTGWVGNQSWRFFQVKVTVCVKL